MEFLKSVKLCPDELRTFDTSLYAFVTSCIYHPLVDKMSYLSACNKVNLDEAVNQISTGIVKKSHIVIAVDKDSPKVCYGFCLFNTIDRKIVFIYVKKKFRKLGVSSFLLADLEGFGCYNIFKNRG